MSIFGKRQAPQKRPKAVSQTSEPAAPIRAGKRNSCYEYLDALMSGTDRHLAGTAVKIYIENFKRLNEIFGYEYCDELLSQILQYLRHTTGKKVLHFVGMEYIIVLERTTNAQAQNICQEILDRFGHVWTVGDIDCLCSVQIGICSYPNYIDTADGLLKCLDMAVTKASEYGSNQMAVYNSILQEQASRRHIIATHLNEALDRQEIDVRYRPTYSIEKKKFVRAELYLRIFVKGILSKVEDGEFICMDASEGVIVVKPDEATEKEYLAKKEAYEQERIRLEGLRNTPAVTKEGKRIYLCANVGNVQDIRNALPMNIDGVGLFRSEFLYM